MVVRTFTGLALVLLLGLVVVPTLAAENVQTLRLVESLSTTKWVDVGVAGRSTGDLRVTAHSLRRAAADADRSVGPKIGMRSTATTVLVSGAGSVVCTAFLPAGSITAGGVARRTARGSTRTL